MFGQIELILSGEPKLRQHPKYAARKKQLNNIIDDKCNRILIDFLKDTSEFELIDLQSCNTWKQKTIDLRQLIEEIEINRLQENVVKNADTEILKVWNSLPNTFNTLKKVAQSILSIFSSTYVCESLFSIMILRKTKQRKTLIDETSAACVSLKTTKYTPDIKMLSSKKTTTEIILINEIKVYK
ncbi:hypothetical protein QTP88_026095 [Uroleucon formosanum]